MVNYRRIYVKSGCYFFTVTVKDRTTKILIENIDLLRSSMRQVQQESFFEIKAIVVLPDHLHCIWQLPENDSNYPRRWQKIKSYFTRKVREKGIKLFKNYRGEYALWQKRYWEHAIRDEVDFENHVNYIHYNPVKHGYVKNVCDWPYSSFHNFVKQGLLPADWGRCEKDVVVGDWGE
ncbi:MAG TPA: transposase [Gammaproteobacteria bacterium]|nr:transposase [Gammaproteobacteria bacterium]